MKRPIVVGVRVSDQELAAFTQLAEMVDRTVPDTLRWLARTAAKERALLVDSSASGAFVASEG